MRTWLLAGLIGMAVALGAFQGLPHCTAVDPDSGKKGDAITAKGESLGKNGVGELFLTDGKNDTKVNIADQSDKEIKFTIPDMKAGRYHLLILTADKASLIDQPVVVTVQ